MAADVFSVNYVPFFTAVDVCTSFAFGFWASDLIVSICDHYISFCFIF